MNRLFLFSAMLAALCMLSINISRAQTTITSSDIPRTISYQGVLTNTDGSPVADGTYPITVSLYADPTGSLKVWNDTYSASVVGGVFSLYLGSGNHPLPDAAAMNSALWIGTRIGDAPEMLPLTPLAASPYAMNVPNKAITTAKLADGAVTAAKVSMPYISAVEIDGQKVDGVGMVLRLESGSDIALDYDEATNSIVFASNKRAANGTAGDQEKESTVQDNTDPNDNWLGRDAGSNLSSFLSPLGDYNAIAGGYLNTVGSESQHSTIAGGRVNEIDEYMTAGFIGGGEDNHLENISTAIPPVSSRWLTIAGGHQNEVWSDHGFVGGGHLNIVESESGTIVGGYENTVQGVYGFIGGGRGNSTNADNSAVVGGYYNAAVANCSFVGGGEGNGVNTHRSSIVGGYLNDVSAELSAIGGGSANYISEPYSFIGGGEDNSITATHSVIIGGRNNETQGDYSAIGGGSQNVTTGNMSAILGGENLETTSYAQTAVGMYNASRGTLTTPFYIGVNNDPIFMVGNGRPAWHPFFPNPYYSNAFEVSYSGHSVVYDINGTSSNVLPWNRIPIRGATYVDNILYAWGDVTGGGGVNADFGVRRVFRNGAGDYDIEIDVLDPQTGAKVVLNNVSITATLTDFDEPPPCAFITASRIGTGGPNHFRVRIRDVNCDPIDAHFMFKVTGRP